LKRAKKRVRARASSGAAKLECRADFVMGGSTFPCEVHFLSMNPTLTESQATLYIAFSAAFADGQQSEAERTSVNRVIASLGEDVKQDLFALLQDALQRRHTLESLAAALPTREARLLAQEIAVAICTADGSCHPAETAFLGQLGRALGLAEVSAAAVPPPVVAPPVAAEPLEPADTAAVDQMVLNYAILTGALELLPQNLATMAIVPLQMKMVYRVGQRHGYALDRGHIRDFAAAAGVGFAAQALEGFARKLLGGFAGNMLGGLGRGVVRTGTGAAFTFASTYALGQLAARYYAGGRQMNSALLRDTYTRLLQDGSRLFGGHTDAVAARARTLGVSDVMDLARGP
jgi:tellurite resistance protein/uncharacterized protein (DUF697 family)